MAVSHRESEAECRNNPAALRGAGRRKLITIGETMIQIAISQAAFDAIAVPMLLGQREL
jgi:hypothetical protein